MSEEDEGNSITNDLLVKNVLLVSQEGESFEIPVEVAIMSELIKRKIDGNIVFF